MVYMRNLRIASLTLGAAIVLSGCSPALSDEVACKEVGKYAVELSSTSRNMTDNLAKPDSLAVYSKRMIEISDELDALNIGSRDISDTVAVWSSSAREFGVFFSSGWEYGDEVKQIVPVLDQFLVANSKMIRLCDL